MIGLGTVWILDGLEVTLLRRRQMEDIYWVTLFYTRVAMLCVVALGFAVLTPRDAAPALELEGACPRRSSSPSRTRGP